MKQLILETTLLKDVGGLAVVAAVQELSQLSVLDLSYNEMSKKVRQGEGTGFERPLTELFHRRCSRCSSRRSRANRSSPP